MSSKKRHEKQTILQTPETTSCENSPVTLTVTHNQAGRPNYPMPTEAPRYYGYAGKYNSKYSPLYHKMGDRYYIFFYDVDLDLCIGRRWEGKPWMYIEGYTILTAERLCKGYDSIDKNFRELARKCWGPVIGEHGSLRDAILHLTRHIRRSRPLVIAPGPKHGERALSDRRRPRDVASNRRSSPQSGQGSEDS